MTPTDFLRHFHDGDLWPVTTIGGGKVEAHSFDEEKTCADWIAARDGRSNIYFNPATPKDRLTTKAKKDDIASTRWLWIDADPIKLELAEAEKMSAEDCKAYYIGERAELLKAIDALPLRPTVVVFSGNGYQCFWRLKQPMSCSTPDQVAAVEAKNRWLGAQVGTRADDTWNVDRIMRLHGTRNVPTDTKRKQGITWTSPAEVDRHRSNWQLEYDAEEFGEIAATTTTTIANQPTIDLSNLPAITALEDISALRGAQCESLRYLIIHGHRPNLIPAYKSRSEALLAATRGMLLAGVGAATATAIILDKRFAISESVLEKRKGARAYALRQVQKVLATPAAAASNTASNSDPNKFTFDKDGNIIANDQHNIRLAVDKLGVKLSHDVFADRMPIEGLDGFDVLDDASINRLWLNIDTTFKFRPTFDLFYRVVTDAARRNAFHPVRDYLDQCQAAWDGNPRLDSWLIRHGGADDTPYVRAVSAIGPIAAVRRIRQPAIKFDEMPTFQADQGTNKSGAVAALSPREEWFSDDLPLNCDSQEVIERTAGKWIIEAAELSGMKRAPDIERLKSFMSRRVDRARPAYGRLPVDRPRQFIIFGTTNESQYLTDTTGNRRFWPIKVVRFDVAAIVAERDMLWGEAATREATGESIRLNERLWPSAAEEQEQRRAGDPWEERLRDIIGSMVGKVRIDDAFRAVGKLKVADRTQADQERLGRAMRLIGFRHARLHFGGGAKVGAYVKGETEQERSQIIRVIAVVDEYQSETGEWRAEYFSG